MFRFWKRKPSLRYATTTTAPRDQNGLTWQGRKSLKIMLKNACKFTSFSPVEEFSRLQKLCNVLHFQIKMQSGSDWNWNVVRDTATKAPSLEYDRTRSRWGWECKQGRFVYNEWSLLWLDGAGNSLLCWRHTHSFPTNAEPPTDCRPLASLDLHNLPPAHSCPPGKWKLYRHFGCRLIQFTSQQVRLDIGN